MKKLESILFVLCLILFVSIQYNLMKKMREMADTIQEMQGDVHGLVSGKYTGSIGEFVGEKQVINQ